MIEHNLDTRSVTIVPRLVTTVETIADDIKRIRKERGLTRVALGKLIKSNPCIIYNHETGMSVPDLRTLVRYSRAMNIEIVFSPKKR